MTVETDAILASF